MIFILESYLKFLIFDFKRLVNIVHRL